MSRPLRIAYQDAWYHVMNRGLAHKPIFFEDSHRQIFLDLKARKNHYEHVNFPDLTPLQVQEASYLDRHISV